MTKDERALWDRLSAWRRALHMIPECGYQEHKTQAYLMDELGRMNPDALVPMADTGVCCVFFGKDAEKAVAFRSDIDALGVKEKTGLQFASKHEGVMHACGHDGHMAIALATAMYAGALRDRGGLNYSVKVLFQPAEESIGGAKRMIDEGALENPYVERVYGLHMMPDVQLGRLACRPGPMMASTRELDIRLTGQSAHGAMPHRGRDAVAAMCSLYPMIQTALSRRTPAGEAALFTAGRVSAGRRRNIIAGEALLECTARAFSGDTSELILDIINDAIRAVGGLFGVEGEVIEHVYYPVVDNHEGLFARFRELAGGSFVLQEPLLVAEDFSYYQMHRPGLFYYVGCGDDAHCLPLHSDGFDFDEGALLMGALMNRMLLDDYQNGGTEAL